MPDLKKDIYKSEKERVTNISRGVSIYIYTYAFTVLITIFYKMKRDKLVKALGHTTSADYTIERGGGRG